MLLSQNLTFQRIQLKFIIYTWNYQKKIGLGNPSIDKKPRFPYNILITNNWIAIIKRKYDHVHGFSVNGLGFAGYLLVTEKSNINYLKKYGPEKLLENFVWKLTTNFNFVSRNLIF